MQKGLSKSFTGGALKALGLAELGGIVKNEIRLILTEFESIKGISPEAKDSISAFSDQLVMLRDNARSMGAQVVASFASLGTNIGLYAGQFIYGKDAADAARQQIADEQSQARRKKQVEATTKEVAALTKQLAAAEAAAGKAVSGLSGPSLSIDERQEALQARLGGIMAGLAGANDGTPEGLKKRLDLFKDMESTAKSLERVNGEINDRLREQSMLARQVGGELAASFENAVFSGGKLKDMVNSILQDIARLIFQQTITKPLAGAITGMFGSLFGGAKASGGPVSAGMLYQVNERGTEAFIPSTSGTIIPNHKLGGGGTTVVYDIDARGASVDAVRELKAMMAAMNASIEPRSVAAVRSADKRRK